MRIVEIIGYGLRAIDSNGDEIQTRSMGTRVDLKLVVPAGKDASEMVIKNSVLVDDTSKRAERRAERIEDKKEKIRDRRTVRLAQVDKWCNDIVLGALDASNAPAIRVYRKALFDITKGIDENSDPANITWPTKPSFS